MLQLVEGGFGTVQSSPAVAKLQVALAGLAQASGKPMINPGPATGYVGPTTVNSVVAAMGLLTQHLGSAGGVIKAGLAVYSIFDQARAQALITEHAARLEQAARAATLAVAQGQQSPGAEAPAVPPPTLAPTVRWYKTWWGIGAIGLGALGLVALLTTPRRAAPAA